MTANSKILLSSSSHSDNNSIDFIIGDKEQGAGFYNRSNCEHSVQYNCSNFTGTISIQGTLMLEPQEQDWITINDSIINLVSDSTTDTNGYIRTFEGNFVWVRVVVEDWMQGAINQILLNY